MSLYYGNSKITEDNSVRYVHVCTPILDCVVSSLALAMECTPGIHLCPSIGFYILL